MTSTADLVSAEHQATDEFFGQLAVEQGFCSATDVSEALRIQALNLKSGRYYRLGVIMVKKGLLDADEAKRILRQQNTAVLEDPESGQRFNVIHYDPQLIYQNPGTGNRLRLADDQSGGVDGTLHGQRDGERPAAKTPSAPAAEALPVEELPVEDVMIPEPVEPAADEEAAAAALEEFAPVILDEDEEEEEAAAAEDAAPAPADEDPDADLFEDEAPAIHDEPIIDAHQPVEFLDEDEAPAHPWVRAPLPERSGGRADDDADLFEDEEAADVDGDLFEEEEDAEEEEAVLLDEEPEADDAGAEEETDDARLAADPSAGFDADGDDQAVLRGEDDEAADEEADDAAFPAAGPQDDTDVDDDVLLDDDERDAEEDETAAVDEEEFDDEFEEDDDAVWDEAPAAAPPRGRNARGAADRPARAEAPAFAPVDLRRAGLPRAASRGPAAAHPLPERSGGRTLPDEPMPPLAAPDAVLEVDDDTGPPTGTEGVPPAPPAPAAGTEFAGCVLEAPGEALGRCAVWTARHTLLERPVALHLVPLAALDDAERDELRGRCKQLLRRQSDGLQRLIDFGEEDGCYYLVRERTSSLTLRAFLDQAGPFGEDEVRDLLEALVRALGEARALHLAYQPVTAANVVRTADGALLAGLDYTQYRGTFAETRATADLARLAVTLLTGAPPPADEEALLEALRARAMSVELIDVLCRVLFPGDEPPLLSPEALVAALHEDHGLVIEAVEPADAGGAARAVRSVSEEASGRGDRPVAPADAPPGAAAGVSDSAALDLVGEPEAADAAVAFATGFPAAADRAPGAAAGLPDSAAPDFAVPAAHQLDAQRQSNWLAVVLFVGLLVVVAAVLILAGRGGPDDTDRPAPPAEERATTPPPAVEVSAASDAARRAALQRALADFHAARAAAPFDADLVFRRLDVLRAEFGREPEVQRLLSARVPVTLRTNAPDAPVWVAGDYVGRTDAQGALALGDLATGAYDCLVGDHRRYQRAALRLEVPGAGSYEPTATLRGAASFWAFPVAPGMTRAECDAALARLASFCRDLPLRRRYATPDEGLICELLFTAGGRLAQILLPERLPASLGAADGGRYSFLDGLSADGTADEVRAVLGPPENGAGDPVPHWSILRPEGRFRLARHAALQLWVAEAE